MEAYQEHWASGAFPFHHIRYHRHPRIRPLHTRHMFHWHRHMSHSRHWSCLAGQNFDASHSARLVFEVVLPKPTHALHLQAVLEEEVAVSLQRQILHRP